MKNMRKTMIALLFGSLTAAPAVLAAQTGSSAAKPAKTAHTQTHATKAQTASGKTHMVSGEFVSYDPVAKKATVKDEKGQTSAVPLEGKAISEVAHVKAGEKVMLTCRDNARGEHQAITAIKPAK
jgi:hypothetical protein